MDTRHGTTYTRFMIEMDLERQLGSISLSLPEEITVGSYYDFTLTYTAGFFGIDDSGSIKICFRYATDMGVPQFDRPEDPNYIEITSDADVTLVPRFDTKDNVRPWGKTIYIKVTNGYLVEGDRVFIRFGSRDHGGRGFRVQTFCESSWEFRVLVDVFACYRYAEVPARVRAGAKHGLRSNEVRLVPQAAIRRRGQAPGSVVAGEPFVLRFRGEDMWGNPAAISLESIEFLAPTVSGLPDRLSLDPSANVVEIPGLSCPVPGILRIEAKTPEGAAIPIAPVEVLAGEAALKRYWADLHGQSEETIGTNSVDDYFRFARYTSWLDVAAHQGNDFQITSEFWEKLQEATKHAYEPGAFVTFPGYEWSANTGLGGDHNVYYFEEGETIHRSCHALVDDLSDIETDCNRLDELFETLSGSRAMVIAHVGGRYASLPMDDPSLRRSVEIHSAWGTFRWLLEDAFALGQRVGVVCNSDGHKGRPGASYPGASLFGSYGGLTCLLAPELTREAIWDAYMRRHHYGTTGARMLLDVTADIDDGAVILDVDGKPLETLDSGIERGALMGDIVQTDSSALPVCIDVHGSSPIERIEVRNGLELLETYRPYGDEPVGKRLRIMWEGAAFRGRGRQVDWNGCLRITGNRIVSFEPVNFYNPDRTIDLTPDGEGRSFLEWRSFTTGGISGVILTLESVDSGTLKFEAGPVGFELPLSEIGDGSRTGDTEYTAPGIDVRVRVSRLPEVNSHLDVRMERVIALQAAADNPVYVAVYQEDGHIAWSSPIYAVRPRS